MRPTDGQDRRTACPAVLLSLRIDGAFAKQIADPGIYTVNIYRQLSDAIMTKVLPVFLALIPFAALVGACAVTG
jgi:hypothetical protein